MIARACLTASLGLLALGTPACLRSGFDVADDVALAADAAVADTARTLEAGSGDLTASDARRPTCLPWTGTVAFGPAERLDEINSPQEEIEPFVTADGLTITLGSTRPGGSGGYDIWIATRASVDDPFTTPQPYPNLNSAANEYGLALSRDQRTGLFSTDRAGGLGGADLWIVTRADANAPFAAATAQPLAQLNSANDEHDPFLSADGLRLYFLSVDFIASNSASDLVIAERASGVAPFGPPRALAVDQPGRASEGNPSLSDDGLVLVFNSSRNGVFDIYYSTRASPDDPFGDPQPIAELNTSAAEGEPFLTGDGCAIYFSREPGGGGDSDLYRALLVRP